MVASMRPVISISQLTKTYASGLSALKNIDLEIHKGEIFALLGPNGAGKTTLINIVCGIVTPTSGVVLADGHDILRDYRAARSKIGLVPQELTTDAFETVWATVTFSRGLFGRAPNPAHIEKVLRDLSLWDKRKDRIMTLSGGMKRRVMIAKALSHEPEILFLDEPTAGVDVELRRDMWALVRRLRDERRDDHPDHALHRRGRGDGRSHRHHQQGRADPGRGEGEADAEAGQAAADAEPAGADDGDPRGAPSLAVGVEGRGERAGVHLRRQEWTLRHPVAAAADGGPRDRVQGSEHAPELAGGDLRQPGQRPRGGPTMTGRVFNMNGLAFNRHGVWAIYRFEMARFMRTLLQSVVTPVITTSLYFVVFGSAIGSRMSRVDGVPYGAFIVPGLIMLSLFTASISNASFGIYFPKFTGTIYELLSAPISFVEMIIGYVGAAATKSILLGLIILGTAAFFVPVQIRHPLWMIAFLLLTATTFSLFGFVIGIWAKGFEQLQLIPMLVVTPLTFLGGAFYSIDMLPADLAHGRAVQPGRLPDQRLPLELLRHGGRRRGRQPGDDVRVPADLAGGGGLDVQDGVPAEEVKGGRAGRGRGRGHRRRTRGTPPNLSSVRPRKRTRTTRRADRGPPALCICPAHQEAKRGGEEEDEGRLGWRAGWWGVGSAGE